VYKELKKQIISLEQKPGAVIREKEIMKSFKVSRTPVREALMRLEMDGLVRIIPNSGTFVEEISLQKLKDVIEIRSHFVKLAGKLAASRISKEEIDEIRDRIKQIKTTTDPKSLMQLDGEIHDIIRDATKNELLVKMLKGLHDRVVRIWTYVGANNESLTNIDKEFEAIATALEQRDEETTARLLEKHTNTFTEHVRKQLTF